jgi:hypothetical protein
MRHWYITKSNHTREGKGSRGGIRTKDGEDWALEIGQDQFANPDLYAVAVLHDEIVEFLELYRDKSVLAAALHDSYRKLKEEIEDSLRRETNG